MGSVELGSRRLELGGLGSGVLGSGELGSGGVGFGGVGVRGAGVGEFEVRDQRNSGWGIGSEKLGLRGWSRSVGSGE